VFEINAHLALIIEAGGKAVRFVVHVEFDAGHKLYFVHESESLA